MTARPIPVDSPVLTDEQVDAYITYQMALLDGLMAKRKLRVVTPMVIAPRLRDQRVAS